jgi:flagellar protein FliL
MAKAAAKPSNDESPKPPAGKKKLLLILVGAVLLMAMTVGGTVVALKVLSPPQEKSAEKEEHKEEPPKKAQYIPLSAPLMLNFAVDGKQKFLQTHITLMTRDDKALHVIEIHQSMLRNALNMLIGSKSFESLQTAEGKEALRQECLAEIQKLMQVEMGAPGVEEVLFTTFIMQ